MGRLQGKRKQLPDDEVRRFYLGGFRAIEKGESVFSLITNLILKDVGNSFCPFLASALQCLRATTNKGSLQSIYIEMSISFSASAVPLATFPCPSRSPPPPSSPPAARQ